MDKPLSNTTTDTKTELQNKITKVPGSSDFLRFILSKGNNMVISPTRKKGKMFTYSPVLVERKFGINPKNQRAILRILKNNFHCLGYKFVTYDDVGNGLKVNWVWYKKLVEERRINYNEALKRIHYKEAHVSLRENYKDVYDDIFSLDEVVFRVSIKWGAISSDDAYVLGNAPISLCINDRKVYTTSSTGSNTKYILDLAFNDENRLENGMLVQVDRKMNLSDVLLSTVKRNGTLKKLIYSDIKNDSFRVYPKITNRMLIEKGLTKADVEDIINTI